MNRTPALLAALMLLAGCQTQLQHQTPPADAAPAVQAQPAATAAAEAPVHYRDFDQDTLYSLLVAELAGQRNQFDVALEQYASQARKTADAGVTERAFRIAEYLGDEPVSLDTALEWARLAPADMDAQRAAAIQLARNGEYEQSMHYMEKVLGQQGATHFDFLALSALETDAETRGGLLQSFDRLLEKYPENGQLLFGKALLLQQDGREEEALAILQSQPDASQEAASFLLQARILQNLQRGEQAQAVLEKGVQRFPDDKRLRLNHARLLVERNQLDKAKLEFSELVMRYPDDDDLRFSMALVCLESSAWQEAVDYLNELIERGSHLDAAYYNLGRAYEELQAFEQARLAYVQVEAGSEFLPAQARLADLLIERGELAKLEAQLQRARDDNPDYALHLYLIEIETLSRHGREQQADLKLQQALEQYPDEPNLLYSRAMLAEKQGNLAQLEQDLRRLIEQDPENAMALNALGYTLADQTSRHEEALALIERAYELSPDDPAILDSLGWVNFRLGNLAEAETLLRQAYEKLPDAEVAAHLGEVLWHNGKRKEARRLWQHALEQSPDDRILLDTLERLAPKNRSADR